MTTENVLAVGILHSAIGKVLREAEGSGAQRPDVVRFLYHAIRHLAYPDRDIYPKTRKGTKGAPIVRRQRTVDDLR